MLNSLVKYYTVYGNRKAYNFFAILFIVLVCSLGQIFIHICSSYSVCCSGAETEHKCTYLSLIHSIDLPILQTVMHLMDAIYLKAFPIRKTDFFLSNGGSCIRSEAVNVVYKIVSCYKFVRSAPKFAAYDCWNILGKFTGCTACWLLVISAEAENEGTV